MGGGGGNVRDTATMARSAGTERPEDLGLEVGSSASVWLSCCGTLR